MKISTICIHTQSKNSLLAGILLLGLTFCVTLKVQAAGDAWEAVGGGTYLSEVSHGFPALAFHPDNHDPYVAIVENANAIQVKHFDGTSWSNYGPAVTSGELDEAKLAFNPGNNELYLAYWDVTLHKVVVLRYDGSSWVDVGPHGVSDNDGFSISLAFNPANNYPYVAYNDQTLRKLVVKMYNGSSWENVGPFGISDTVAFYPIFAFNPYTNEPYVAYNDTGNGNKLRVMKYTGTWETVGSAGISSGYVTYLDLAFHPTSQQPYVVYTEEDLHESLYIKRFDGSAWQDVSGPSGDDASGEEGEIAFCPSTNDLYVAYSKEDSENNIVVRKYNGSSWELVGTKGFNTYEAGYFDFGIQPSTNEPYLVFEDDAHGTILHKLGIYKYNKVVSSRPTIPYKNKKSAKKNLTLTFKDLKITTKKGWVKVWLGGKKQKVRSVKKSGNNLKVALRVKYGKWARGNYNLRMQFKKKVGNHTQIDNWRSLNALTIL